MKRIDFSKKTFTANGVEYHYSDSLSIDRYEEFEKLQVLMGYNLDYEQIFDELKELYKSLNKTDFVKASVTCFNLLDATKRKMDKKVHPALQICGLFINEKGEDSAVLDQKKMEEKINNWKKEGLAMQDFFSLASNLVRGFIKNFNSDLQESLAEIENMKIK